MVGALISVYSVVARISVSILSGGGKTPDRPIQLLVNNATVTSYPYTATHSVGWRWWPTPPAYIYVYQ